jgi:hypothetical protein
MAFNHYAKLKRILADQPDGWYVKRIDEPTTSQTFSGETRSFDHYYRLYAVDGTLIKYGKFQQIDRLAQALGCTVDELPIL